MGGLTDMGRIKMTGQEKRRGFQNNEVLNQEDGKCMADHFLCHFFLILFVNYAASDFMLKP